MKSQSGVHLGFLFLSIATKSINIFPSGMPQVSDFILVLGILVYIFQNRGVIYLQEEHKQHIKRMAGIVLYQFMMNFIWYHILDNSALLTKSMYYVFNLLSFAYVLVLFNEYGYYRLQNTFVAGILSSAILSMLGVFLVGGQRLRRTGFFNNPNQLGYFAIIIVAFAFFVFPDIRKKLIVIVLSAVMVIMSGSKAALIGMAVFALLYGLFYKSYTSSSIFRRFVILGGGFILLYLLLFSRNERIISNSLIMNLRYRFLNLESDDYLWEGRGYERIAEVGMHFIWGLGEGGFDRFTVMHGVESHSAYVTIFVSYGLIGLIGYCYIFKKSIGSSIDKIRHSLIGLSGILLYNASHNGIRNTLVWMLLAMLYIMNSTPNYQDDFEINQNENNKVRMSYIK